MRSHNRILLWAGRTLGLLAFVAGSPQPARAQEHFATVNPVFRSDATLVRVPVTVVDRRGATVNGLASGAFTLTENGVRQEIRAFSQVDVPVSMGIVLDLSGSMHRVLGTAKESLRAMLDDANPEDEAFLNAVSSHPRAYSGFTRDLDKMFQQIAFERAGGSTALIDTIYSSLQQLRSGAHARKALLVVSDGMDNHSRYSREELLRFAEEADAQIYAIAVSAPSQTSKPVELMEEKKGILFLEELTAKTGGLSFIVQRPGDIREAATNIGQALRNQYDIGYAPSGASNNGKWRRIGVKVAGPGLRAYARAGYRIE